jgi:NDP-sugar pyrophosphorylase family protein
MPEALACFDEIEALVLAGGAGTRLRRLVPDLPKPLAPVSGRPFVAHLLDRLRAAGIARTVLCTGYRGDKVREALGASWDGMALDYSHEPEPLGTGGALRLAVGKCPASLLLVTNGDSWCDADLAAFLDAHIRAGMRAGLLLAEVPDASRYGRVEVAPSGRVTGFVEKGTAGPGCINAGVYLVERGLLAEIPAGRPVSLEREVIPGWIAAGLYGHRTGGRFIDIGTEDAYRQAESFFRDDRKDAS